MNQSVYPPTETHTREVLLVRLVVEVEIYEESKLVS